MGHEIRLTLGLLLEAVIYLGLRSTSKDTKVANHQNQNTWLHQNMSILLSSW